MELYTGQTEQLLVQEKTDWVLISHLYSYNLVLLLFQCFDSSTSCILKIPDPSGCVSHWQATLKTTKLKSTFNYLYSLITYYI